MSTALDVSHWSGRLTLEQMRAVQAAGVTRIIVGTQDHAIARQQANLARVCGMEVQAYVYLYFAANPAERVRRDLPLLREIGASRYWLDAENDVPGFVGSDYVAGLQAAVAASTVPVGIYTARWWWVPRTGDSRAFSHLPLWTAEYDGKADLSAVRLYGGWTSAAMKQYRPHASHGDPTDGAWFPDRATGVWCDVNVYAAPLAGQAGVSRPMTADDAALIWRMANGDPRDDPAGVRLTPLDGTRPNVVNVARNRRGYYVELPA
jgi:hypothetical protein